MSNFVHFQKNIKRLFPFNIPQIVKHFMTFFSKKRNRRIFNEEYCQNNIKDTRLVTESEPHKAKNDSDGEAFGKEIHPKFY